jgi:hypothetical protein
MEEDDANDTFMRHCGYGLAWGYVLQCVDNYYREDGVGNISAENTRLGRGFLTVGLGIRDIWRWVSLLRWSCY